jgi:hypothetical protein
MLSLEKLKQVQFVVSHENCPDGTVSAILLRDVFPEAEIVFVQYNTDAHKNLPVKPGTLFADFSPHSTRVQEFVDAGALILDHHKTQKWIVEAFGENGVYGDETLNPGVCGAFLVYENVWLPFKRNVTTDLAALLVRKDAFVQKFARLAGVRDTWQTASPEWEEACIQGGLIHYIPNKMWLEVDLLTLADEWEDKYLWLGKMLWEKHTLEVQRAADRLWRFTTKKGTRVVMVLAGKPLVSDVAELLANEADLFVQASYTYEPGKDTYPKLLCSTRSRGEFDAAAFCKAHGGGGHTKAAGMVFSITPESVNPFAFVESLVRSYEGEMASLDSHSLNLL